MTPPPNSVPKPSAKGKVLIVAMTLYAIAVIGPDFLRLGFHDAFRQWYPLATLGFEADNDGIVVRVDSSSEAQQQGLIRGQQILLSSIRPDRRAINKIIYVGPNTRYTFCVVAGADAPLPVASAWMISPATPPRSLATPDTTSKLCVVDGRTAPLPVSVQAIPEVLTGWNAVTLLFAQLSALLFIGLCAYIVWHSSTWATWGFFLYGVWFNSGQYFVWYANLPPPGLIVFDVFQAVVQALALAGFLAFALHFPDERSTHWSSARRLYVLGSVWLILFFFGGAGFLNFIVGWRTELPYRIYYVSTFCVYFLAMWSFLRNYLRLPDERPRMRWIMAAGLAGLPCFLLADIYEATDLFQNLPFGVDDWMNTHDWAVNLMYSCNVVLPLAVLYTARRREVMSVRFGITRAVIISALSVVSLAVFEQIASRPIEGMRKETSEAVTSEEARQPLPLRLFLTLFSLAPAIVVGLIHNPLHGVVERICAPRWHRARAQLQELAERLVEDDTVTLTDVDRALIEDTVAALWLDCAALFQRRPDGTFAIQRHVNWPRDAKCVLLADDPWIRSAMTEPVLLMDSAGHASGPALAVPIARRMVRHPTTRVVLYGYHRTREVIDPDEIHILHALSRAAATAYLRLELEAASEPRAEGAAAPTEGGVRRGEDTSDSDRAPHPQD